MASTIGLWTNWIGPVDPRAPETRWPFWRLVPAGAPLSPPPTSSAPILTAGQVQRTRLGNILHQFAQTTVGLCLGQGSVLVLAIVCVCVGGLRIFWCIRDNFIIQICIQCYTILYKGYFSHNGNWCWTTSRWWWHDLPSSTSALINFWKNLL